MFTITIRINAAKHKNTKLAKKIKQTILEKMNREPKPT